MVVQVDTNSLSQFLPIVIKWDTLHFQYPWSDKDWEELNLDFHTLLIAQEGESPCGFALLNTSESPDSSHLLKIFVLKNARGRGYAKAIMEHAITKYSLKQVYLEVAVNNEDAIGLYRSLGFKNLVRKKAFYSDGCDAFAMLLKCD